MKQNLLTSFLTLVLFIGASITLSAQVEHEVYFDDGDDAIATAIDAAAGGDVILLMSAGSEGHYMNTFTIYGSDHLATGAIPKAITIKAGPDLDDKPVIEGNYSGFYQAYAELNLSGVEIINFGYGIAVKLALDAEAFSIKIDDCFIHDSNRGAVYVSSSTEAPMDSMIITNSVFSNAPLRNAIYLRKAKGKGWDGKSFNHATIKNCLILDAPKAIYIEAPTDGSIPTVIVDHVTIDRCGDGVVSKLGGVNFSNMVIYGPNYAFETYGNLDAPTVIKDVIYTGKLSFDATPDTVSLSATPAIFVDRQNGDYSLASTSPGYQGAADGSDLGMIGLDGTPLPPKYELTVALEGSGYIKNPYLGTESFYVGTEVKVETEDDYEDNFIYYFAGTNREDTVEWREGKSDHEVRIMLTQDTIITAVFKTLPDDQTLTTSVVGAGTVTPEGTNMYWLKEIVEVEATANEGEEFIAWINADGDTITTDAKYEFTMDTTMTLIAHFSGTTALKELNVNNILNVYPNPTTGTFYISINENAFASSIQILDITGKIVSRMNNLNGQRKVEVDISSVPAGVYFGRVSTETNTQTFKIIKK